MKGKVYFIGAGPGDIELITLKAKKIIKSADTIIYAGSLINKEILKYAKSAKAIYDSSKMNLEEILSIMIENVKKGNIVARLHSGDPSIYGAIWEQMYILKQNKIEYEIIPGVSSAFAASARIKKEFTIPNVSQTVIFTRISGKTKVPELENLKLLSKHKATMIIFLSISMIDEVVKALKEGYLSSTPVCILYKVSWPDEKIIFGNLNNIVEKVKKLNIKRHALIIIGDILKDDKDLIKIASFSKLYDKEFSHSFRS